MDYVILIEYKFKNNDTKLGIYSKNYTNEYVFSTKYLNSLIH